MSHEEDQFASWLQSDDADVVADYCARGRRFAAFSDADLSEAWQRAFRAVTFDFTDAKLMAAYSDYTAEYDLRGKQPPFELVPEAVAQMTSAFKDLIAQDPAAEMKNMFR